MSKTENPALCGETRANETRPRLFEDDGDRRRISVPNLQEMWIASLQSYKNLLFLMFETRRINTEEESVSYITFRVFRERLTWVFFER